MPNPSRRDFLYLSLAAGAGLARAADEKPAAVNVHQQILELAATQEKQRRARFAAVKTQADLQALQKSLREKFLTLLDGLPEKTAAPPAKKVATLEGDDYVVEKLVYESLPGYFVSALLYKPRKIKDRVPGILSPCGHSAVGKAAATYQMLHINLTKRGFIVLTYDPVGQGERSQFWDADKGRSRYNLTCGEHCVLGNPLYLLGTSLARYRIWDGMRGIDYLTSIPEVDAKKIGCVGNSGGGTLTAYIAALDERVQVPVIGCYITTLPRRMGNRITADPDSDPEQDIFGFVSEGIDHAGLLALMAPRPTLLCTAKQDFFPIEGARDTFAEALKFYEAAGAPGRIDKVEADATHGLSITLRKAAYGWFERWLHGRKVEEINEIEVKPRSAKELQVCAEGQVNLTFKSRPLLPLAREQFLKRKKTPPVALKELLRLDPESVDYLLTDLRAPRKPKQTVILCVDGVETASWESEKKFLRALADKGFAYWVMTPRGVGRLRSDLKLRLHGYADPLCGVEGNLAYNAFLVGKSLVGMRVADVLEVIQHLTVKSEPERLVLCGRRDGALVACLAAALTRSVHQVAVEEMPLSFWPLFEAQGQAINAASLVPGLLRDFGDVSEVLAQIGPRKVLAAAGQGKLERRLESVQLIDKPFSRDPELLITWLNG